MMKSIVFHKKNMKGQNLIKEASDIKDKAFPKKQSG